MNEQLHSDNRFTAEAVQTLGLPDSPVIHLAIHTVAELLQPLESQSTFDARSTCISRFRVASGTVLEGLPIECATLKFLAYIGVERVASEVDMAIWSKRTDWLGQAKAALEADGRDPGPETKRMATRYGWDPSPRGR
jgi:hypothetical protein